MDNKNKILLELQKYPRKNIFDVLEELGIAPLWLSYYLFTDRWFAKEYNQYIDKINGVVNI